MRQRKGELKMGMFGKMRSGAKLKCRHCGQKSPIKSKNWEGLGKSHSWLIMACRKCGHGVRMGIFAERHVDKGFIDRMRAARERDLKEYEEQIKGKLNDQPKE